MFSAGGWRRRPTRLANSPAVFHLGACSSTTESDQAYLDDNNFLYTKEMAEWALAQGARFIYASSAATYGDGSAGMDDGSEDLARLHPLNLYGNSKHQFDLHAQQQGWLDRIVGVKYFNVFGPNEDHKGDMRSLVHKAYQQILSTGKVGLFKSYHPEFKDGEQKRDFLYVKDAVEMTLHFADKGNSAGGLFNLGSSGRRPAHGSGAGHGDFSPALKREPLIEFIDMPAVLRDKYQYFTQADIAKLRASGYEKPVTPLAEAVRDYVQAYLVPGKKLGEVVVQNIQHSTFNVQHPRANAERRRSSTQHSTSASLKSEMAEGEANAEPPTLQKSGVPIARRAQYRSPRNDLPQYKAQAFDLSAIPPQNQGARRHIFSLRRPVRRRAQKELCARRL